MLPRMALVQRRAPVLRNVLVEALVVDRVAGPGGEAQDPFPACGDEAELEERVVGDGALARREVRDEEGEDALE